MWEFKTPMSRYTYVPPLLTGPEVRDEDGSLQLGLGHEFPFITGSVGTVVRGAEPVQHGDL
jgi:hypothetical protein